MKTIETAIINGNLTGNYSYRTVKTQDGRDTTVLNFGVAEHEGENTKFYRAAVWGKKADEANARLTAMSEEERKGYFVEVTGRYVAATNPQFNDELQSASVRFIQPKAAYVEAQKAAQAKTRKSKKA